LFTGIVEEVGKIARIGSDKLTVSAGAVLEGLELGASIAVNGICLTITELTSSSFSVAIMEETINRTNIGRLSIGDRVNLERPLTLSKPIGGHLVQGHIDATGKVIALTRESSSTLIKIESPASLMHYIAEKGFIALNGISLTVTERRSDSFSVSIVNHTLQHTILSEVRIGDIVNLEVDIISKYVEQLVNPHSAGLTNKFLQEHGFTL
jgi:riboflavin synthase